jgi:hypothetical protein
LIVFEGGKDQAFVGGGDGRRSGMRFGQDKALPMFPKVLFYNFTVASANRVIETRFPV